MVHIKTNYAIRADDVELLAKTKKSWWLRNNTKEEYVQIGVIACTDPVDIDVDLEDGEYTLGCGDWNVVNDEGKHVSQRNYFYINDGHIHYVKKMSEFPSKGGAVQTSWGNSGWGKKDETPATPTPSTPEYVMLPMAVFCAKGRTCINEGDFDVMAQNCGDYDAEIPSDADSCMNCLHKIYLYIPTPKQ